MKFSIVALLAWALIGLPSASGQVGTATISGTITDESGAVLPGALVKITNTGTAISREITTDQLGHYTAPLLPPGSYQVRSELASFQAEVQTGITLSVGQEQIVNVRMRVGAASQEVSVQARTSLVETTSNALGGVVEEQRIEDLPLNGRNYTELTYLEPGVQRSIRQTTIGGIHGDMTSVNGAGYRSLAYLVDGAYINDAYGMSVGSIAGTSLGVDAVQEFRVTTSTYGAEYGRNMGGVVNVVTKSGTNQMHGSLFEFLRNDVLDARNQFDPAQIPAFRRNQFGGSLGGPIKRDRTFFFVTYEGLRERLGQSLSVTVPSAAARVNGGLVPVISPAIQPFLNLYPVPPANARQLGNGLAQMIIPFTQPTNENFGQARVDHHFTANDMLFVRYTNDSTTRTVPPGSDVPVGQFVDDLQSPNQFAVLNYTKILSPKLLNTARFAFSRTKLLVDTPLLNDPTFNFRPNLPFGAITVTGMNTLGPDNIEPYWLTRNLFDSTDDIVWTRGRHTLKFGGNVSHYEDSFSNSSYARGTWTFTSLANFLQNIPTNAAIVPPGGILTRYYSYQIIGTYIQDEYRLRPNFTLNLGLRYEFQTVPTEVHGNISVLVHPLTDTQYTLGKLYKNPSLLNFSPRVGFAWDPFSNGKTSVRGGIALMYDVGATMTAAVMDNKPPFNAVSTITSGLSSFPSINVAGGVVGTGVRALEYNLGQPKLVNYNFNVQQELPGRMAVKVGYTGSRGYDLIGQIEGNPTPPSGIVNGLPYWSSPGLPRLNPAFSYCVCYTGYADSWYNAFQLSVEKTLTRGLQFQSAFTWSKSLDDTQGQSGAELQVNGPSFPLNPLAFDKGLSEFNVPRNWVSNFVYTLPGEKHIWGGWSFTGLVTIDDGTPFSIGLANGISGQGNQSPTGCCERAQFIGTNINGLIQPQNRQYVNLQVLAQDFTTPQKGFLGNSGRDILSGPGLAMVNFSIHKIFRLTEGKTLEFRAESFNLANRTNYSQPGKAAAFAGTVAGQAPLPNAELITNTRTSSRQNQFGLRLAF